MPKNGTLIERAKAESMTIRQFCQRAVNQHGNIFRAAMALGVSPNTLRYHLGKPEIQEPAKQA